jgi:cytochrome c oxidase cbb3-type subunit III
MKRNNLICVKQILWYIKFSVDAATSPRSGFHRVECMQLPGRDSLRKCGCEKRDVTWRIIPKFGLWLMLLGAIGNALCQNSHREGSTASPQPDLRGKSIFELKCATCHGLDGLGGEHAPDIIRRPAVQAFSDQALLDLIHEGIPESGMPGFSDMGKEDGLVLIAYLHFLQGKSAVDSVSGDPVRGRELFFGKAGCSACHVMQGRGQFAAGDLAGFARDHQASEIREAILRPAGAQQEAATAVARDGRKFSGMIRNEDNSSLQLQDGDGRFYLLMKSSLRSLQRKARDPMPVDYRQRLSATELDDLVGYIVHEAGAPKPPSAPAEKDEVPVIEGRLTGMKTIRRPGRERNPSPNREHRS